MEARQEAKLTMYRAVEQHCGENSAITETTLAFQNGLISFKTKIADIINSAQFTDLSLAGITQDKSNRKQNLAQLAVDTAGIIFAFASTIGNLTLKQEMNIKINKLATTSDDQLSPRCQNIHDRGQENLASLKDYSIEATQLATLQTAINEYSAVTPKPRTAVSQRKTQNANLRQLFKDADAILKDQMNRLVANFRTANPDFVAEYFSNRQIIDPASKTTELRGVITNKTDGSFIKGAVVTITETSATATTNSKGEYSIKTAPIGEFTIRVTATGFQNVEKDEFNIMLGVTNRLDSALEL